MSAFNRMCRRCVCARALINMDGSLFDAPAALSFIGRPLLKTR